MKQYKIIKTYPVTYDDGDGDGIKHLEDRLNELAADGYQVKMHFEFMNSTELAFLMEREITKEEYILQKETEEQIICKSMSTNF